MKPDTLCIHGAKDRTHTTGAVCAPIYQTSTFAHPGVGQSTGYDYTRSQNPTREQLERLMAQLEGGVDALAFSSGMAAITVLMELFSPGDHIIASDDLYGGAMRLFDNVSAKNGLHINYANTGDLAAVEAAITDCTKAIYVETPGNPMMHVSDIGALRALIGQRDILLIVDNTFLTPFYCKPIELGADIVTHSGTKYLGGHNDTLAGFLITANARPAERLRFLYKTTGACLSPFDSFLLIRGIKTLAIRMERATYNAGRIANWLRAHRKIRAVHYVGLADHPAIDISRKQASGFGAMISFETDSVETARGVLERVQTILYAESLGGAETLITYPLLQTHADVPEERRAAIGVTDRLLRLSVGIEHVDDLISDLEQALA
ncbi:MAG: PLP-dependent aspartate aminotransferase family protein [Clostridiales Family XIII bacterium]|jgi:cystathionine beta-lyase/cystathionine gamma-synthase|nr:PLP-dependent aspartate aminotransferase family protein [Clostridiales Family XIII bacterium]